MASRRCHIPQELQRTAGVDSAPARAGGGREETALVCSQGDPRMDLTQMLPGGPGGGHRHWLAQSLLWDGETDEEIT